MASEKSLQLAAQAWCTPKTSGFVMNPILAEAFAEILDEVECPEKKSLFEDELGRLLNRYSMENESNTPDFILAEYLMACLDAFNAASVSREKWYGHSHRPGGS
jgi:hypothetical protein